MSYLLPLPDPEGVAQTKELFLNKYGKAISDEQAADILGRVMKYIYLTTELEHPQSTSPCNDIN